MKKSNLLLLVLSVMMMISYGCSSGNRPSVKPAEQPIIIEADGTMTKIDLEGGFWAIKADNGKTYQSTKELPPMLQVEGLRVHFRGRLATDVASFKMRGEMIHIINIKELPTKAMPQKRSPVE